MNAKVLAARVVIAVLIPLVSVLAGVAAQDPNPVDDPALPGDTDDWPSRIGSGDPCPETNAGDGSSGRFHVYTGSGGAGWAADGCMENPDTGQGVDKAVGSVFCAVEDLAVLDSDCVTTCTMALSTAVTDFVSNPTNPSPVMSSLSDCTDGISKGTDGEFEWGHASAWLNVRDGPHAGNGGGVDVCFGPTFDPHHGAHTTIHVLDVSGLRPGFDVTADWSRGASPGDGDCGDGTVEPCRFSGPPPATPPTPDMGDLTGTIDGTLDWISHNLEATTGCNPLDYADHVDAGVGSWSATAAGFANLADVGQTGYKGGAMGVIVVFIREGTAGWVWTN